ILGDLASDLMSQERFPEAEQLLQRAISILKSHPAFDQRSLPILLGDLGTVYQVSRRNQLAEQTFIEASRASEKYGWDATYAVTLLNKLGAVHTAMGDEGRAEKELRKSLELAERKLGKDSVELSPILTNLAATYERRNKWKPAEAVLLRSLALLEATHGPD